MHSSPLDVGFDVSDTAWRAWRSAAWARAAALACCLSSSFLSASLRSMRSMEPSEFFAGFVSEPDSFRRHLVLTFKR